MNRIDRIFADLRRDGRKALMPFITAGDPSLAVTRAVLPAIEAAGASICELGIPFSDPIADGPVIQASITRAIDAGTHPADVFKMAGELRSQLTIGLVTMVSYSIVHRMTPAVYCQRAAAAGIDGLIVPDLPLEEGGSFSQLAADHGLTCSFLVAPTTPMARARALASASSGFVYVLSRAGLTGERQELPTDLPERLAALREVTNLPLAVGFGISGADQVRAVCQVADAAIVGTALVRRIADGPAEGAAQRAGDFVRELAGGLGA